MTATAPVTVGEPSSEAPKGWRWVPLSDVAELTTGHTPDRKRPDYWNGGIPWINLTEIRDLDGRVAMDTDLQVSDEGIRHSSAVVHPPGTVCFSRTASIGFVTIMGRPMATSQDFVNWICGDEIDPAYLMRALLASRARLRALSSGSTHKTIYVRVAEQFQIALPPPEEQRRIAAVLDKAEDLRAKRRAALAILDTLMESIFLDMFGDPVANPYGWPRGPLGAQLSSIDSGESPVCLGRPVEPGEWGVLKLGAVTRCEYDDRANKALPPGVDPDPRYEVNVGDVLFARKNTHELVGAVALVHETRPRLLLSDLIFRLCPKPDAPLRREYLQQMLVMPSRRSEVRSMAGGSAGSMPNISKERLRSIDIELPPLALQEEFAQRVRATRSAIASGARHLLWADTLFASIQQRAFRGEL